MLNSGASAKVAAAMTPCKCPFSILSLLFLFASLLSTRSSIPTVWPYYCKKTAKTRAKAVKSSPAFLEP
jgi:hypothetical protein